MAITKDIVVSVLVDGENAPIFPESGIMAIRESMDYFVPSAVFEFRDELSTFVSVYPFLQDTKVQISMDDGEFNRRMNFFAFSDSKLQMENSLQEAYDYKLDLLSTYSDPLLLDSEFHSARMKASDYVKYLADRLGVNFDVEDSRDVRTWINPNWTYGQMMRYLAQRSTSASNSSGYMYYLRDDGDGSGTLVFKTIDSFFNEATSEEDITLYLENEELGRDIQIRNNNFSVVTMQGNTSRTRYWNYTTGEYVSKDVAYDEPIQKRALKQGVSQEYAERGRERYFRGVYADMDVPSLTYIPQYRQAMLQAESTQLRFTTFTNLERKLGDIVNISMSTREDVNQQGGVDINYSGRYMIKGMVSKNNGDGYQTLYLVRPGINLSDSRTGFY